MIYGPYHYYGFIICQFQFQVICQEVYDCTEYFHPLKAPKNDGVALVKALRQMDFQVFAFANITLQVNKQNRHN